MRPNPLSLGDQLPRPNRVLAALALQLPTATAEEVPRPTDSGFSFAVYGDSRSMMYLPYKSDQEAEARKLMVDHVRAGACRRKSRKRSSRRMSSSSTTRPPMSWCRWSCRS